MQISGLLYAQAGQLAENLRAQDVPPSKTREVCIELMSLLSLLSQMAEVATTLMQISPGIDMVSAHYSAVVENAAAQLTLIANEIRLTTYNAALPALLLIA